jgi:hypothetical protein
MRKAYAAMLSLGGIAALACLLAWYSPLRLLMVPFEQNPGPFDRKRLSSVVDHVRMMGIKPGEQRQFVLNAGFDPTSLVGTGLERSFRPGQGEGRVWAAASQSGALTVVVETRDLGHGGEYGFAYSDVPLAPQPFGESWLRLDVPGPLNQVTPKMKIDAHWWSVENRLD